MNRRNFQRTLLLTAVTAPLAGTLVGQQVARAAPPPPQLCRRVITEYELPPADTTHELVKVPDTPLVVVSQMSNSTLVKLWLDPDTEEVRGIRAFPLGAEDAMLHGLAVSTRYPGLIWATHEAGNQLLLVNPGADRLRTPPEIVDTIDIPDGGQGPHYVGEYDDLLWTSLKGSDQVLAIDHTDPRQYTLYEAEAHPIFVARHPETDEFYVSQDGASKILRIDPTTEESTQIEIPETTGQTPVGLVAGPAGLWVALLGTADEGTGTFGRINGDGEITWFRLTSPAAQRAGLLHIAFDPPVEEQRSAWLLGSSVISPNVLDQIIRVTFDSAYTKITSEEVATLPTQLCKAHRLLPLDTSVLVTELTSAAVAQLATDSGCRWNQPTTTESAPDDA